MKNYYYIAGERVFSVDSDGEFPKIDNNLDRAKIDHSYRIKEDGVLKVKDHKGNIVEYEVKENDVLFIMYSNTGDWYNRQIIIVRDDRFIKYFKDLDEFTAKQEEIRNNGSDICGCNDCCEASC